MGMLLGLRIVVGWMALVVLFGLVTLGWAVYGGQLDDLEETKYIPFNEKEPVGWPGRDDSDGGGVAHA